MDRLNLVSREILTGIMPIRAFSREKYEEERFDAASKDLMRTQLFTNRTMTFMMPAMTLIMNGVSLLIVWFGGHAMVTDGMQVGDLIAFITYTMQIVMSFLMLTVISIMLPRAGVAADRIEEVLRTEPVIEDPAPAQLPTEYQMARQLHRDKAQCPQRPQNHQQFRQRRARRRGRACRGRCVQPQRDTRHTFRLHQHRRAPGGRPHALRGGDGRLVGRAPAAHDHVPRVRRGDARRIPPREHQPARRHALTGRDAYHHSTGPRRRPPGTNRSRHRDRGQTGMTTQ